MKDEGIPRSRVFESRFVATKVIAIPSKIVRTNISAETPLFISPLVPKLKNIVIIAIIAGKAQPFVWQN